MPLFKNRRQQAAHALSQGLKRAAMAAVLLGALRWLSTRYALTVGVKRRERSDEERPGAGAP
jgi:hypothetical protein